MSQFRFIVNSTARIGRYCYNNIKIDHHAMTINRVRLLSEQPSSNRDGDDSFALGLYCGKVNTQQLFPYPDALDDESKDTVKLMIDPFEKYFREIHDASQCDLDEKLPKKSIEVLKELGALGMLAPQEYGGMQLKRTQYARITEIIGSFDASISVFLGSHQGIGYKGIVLFGNEQQKQKYLPSLVTGEKIAAFCLTEPSAGSDANSILSKAVLDDDGKHYILNGSKIWISNGGIADVMTVFAQVPFKKDDSDQQSQAVTAFIVERDFGGVTSGPPEKKMGLRSSNTAAVYFDNVKIPVENVIGKVGEGFKVAMHILNEGRYAMGAAMTGAMRMFTAKTIEHANNRVQFGQHLIQYQSIQEKIAQMGLSHYAVESVTYAVSNNMDRGIKEFQVEAAISKIFSSESAWNVCDDCIQILAGMGFMRENQVERFMRDIRICRIFEGTNDILRLFIALNGIQYAGKNMKELQKALQQPISNLGTLWDQGVKRSKRLIGIADSQELLEVTAPELSDCAKMITQRVEEFGATIEKLLLKHGRDIIDQQFILNRIANATIDIYSMAAVLSRASKAIGSIQF
ncbi:Very long-chain specific acyl-CoA dehydrogenase, mitochondrial [Trichoplax sp. H2]|nr:Very long-chain specific acyl-CoA dehydrogenase, mitochondrial [Trichoplax sp. H2]|eukprot:RDD46071.1 Very long-chain specific acyl-CoA dehydrogenase, mitochondrial [Trichoplax sp. H2]